MIVPFQNLKLLHKPIFRELKNCNKPVSVHLEYNILVIKVGDADTRLMNWETMTPMSILSIASGLVLQENYKGNVLLHG